MRALIVVMLSLCVTTACHQGSEEPAMVPEAAGEGSAEAQVPVGESTDLVEPAPAGAVMQDPSSDPPAPHPSGPGPDSESSEGPFRVGEDVEPPRRLGGPGPIEELVAMMRSGEYVWGGCIFQVTISESGEVGDLVFLKPERLAPEVEQAITEGVQRWRFSPATRDGEPVAVYYNLLIHHCPYRKRDSEE